MIMTNIWEDNVLIRLKRKYSKDELVSGLIRQLSEKDVEIGKLKSEICELNYNLKNDGRLITKELKSESRFIQMSKQIKEINRKNVLLQKTNSDLVTKLIILKNKQS